MLSRKRRATEDEILPMSKVPRTTQRHLTQDENASPGQHLSIAGRWGMVASTLAPLCIDTLKASYNFLISIVGINSESSPQVSAPDSPRPPPCTKGKDRHRKKSKTKQPIAGPSHLSPPPRTQEAQTSASYPTGLPSPPPTHLSSSSSTSVSHLSDNATYNIAVAKLDEAARKRKYKERPHIFQKAYEADLAKTRQEGLDNMMKELYEIKRSTGYFSSYKTFTDFIDYRRRLELLEAHDSILTTSRSLTDLHEKTEQEVNRRHSQSDEQFLLRAIERARASLNTPKPPKPFSPAFDNLRVRGELQDESIEKRIRPKAIPIPDSLPPQDEEHVRHLLRKKGVIAKCVREQVMDKDLALLKPSEWLNDEVINFYGQMILSRSEACKENPGAKSDPKARGKPLNVHYFSTFFWAKLKGEGYERARLAKWTKKIDIFSKDIILIPINHNNAHWTAAAINFRQKRIESYDSMGMERPIVYKLLRMYLDAEHRNKKKKPFDFTGWVDYVMEDIPQQENMFDCGVFTCQFLEYLSRGEEYFPFSQPNMPYFRRRMIWEIGNCKLRDDP